MKLNRSIPNFGAGLAILFALLFQSFHGIEHLSEFANETHCDHNYADDENQISHSHHSLENCFSCEFTFSQATSPELWLESDGLRAKLFKPASKSAPDIVCSAGQTLQQLRGPPGFIA